MTRDFQLKVKTLQDTGVFTGYASTYGNTDLVGDVIAPGAFAQSIKQQGIGFPLLWAHDQAQPVGVGRIEDSPAGLIVNGKLVLEDPAGTRALLHLKAGSIRGLSIGFDTLKAVGQPDGVRLLREVRLHEISLVAVPCNPLAQVTSVKAIAQVLSSLRSDAVQPADRATLVEIHGALKRLLGVKDAMCICDCPECLAGDCAECSNPDCEDPNCEGSQAQAETLRELRSLAAELRM